MIENKQLTHIVTEIVVLLGITFYFSKKNKKLTEHIEGLAQRLEEQEDRIQKLESAFNQINNLLKAQIIPSVDKLNIAVRELSKKEEARPVKRKNIEPSISFFEVKNPVKQSTPVVIEEEDEVSSEREGSLKQENTPLKVVASERAIPPEKASVPERVIPDETAETSEDDTSDLDAEIQEELSELKE